MNLFMKQQRIMKKVTNLADMLRGLSAMNILLVLFTLVFTLTACSGNDEEEQYIELYPSDTDGDDSDSSDEDSSSSGTSNNGGSTSSGTYKGHEYVDLGLSVKWATMNVGASSPEGYGSYYAWGETSTKSLYQSYNSVTYGIVMNDISGNEGYDAATVIWGGAWRMPTLTEIDELIDYCTWKWTNQNGVNGMLVTGSNGNSIFLPAAGDTYDTSIFYTGEEGNYWSSTPLNSNSDTKTAERIYFNSNKCRSGGSSRFMGYTIRPVLD